MKGNFIGDCLKLSSRNYRKYSWKACKFLMEYEEVTAKKLGYSCRTYPMKFQIVLLRNSWSIFQSIYQGIVGRISDSIQINWINCQRNYPKVFFYRFYRISQEIARRIYKVVTRAVYEAKSGQVRKERRGQRNFKKMPKEVLTKISGAQHGIARKIRNEIALRISARLSKDISEDILKTIAWEITAKSTGNFRIYITGVH